MTASLERHARCEVTQDEDALEERALLALPWVAALCPLAWEALAHALAWRAMLHLGHWPRPSWDDPGSLDAPGFRVAYLAVLIGLPVLLSLGGVALGACGWVLYRRGAQAAFARALLVGASLSAWMAFARWDPTGVGAWLMD